MTLSLFKKPSKFSHCYFLIGCNVEHNALNLYDPRCAKRFLEIFPTESSPPSLTESADPDKGEVWLAARSLEEYVVRDNALQPKGLYKSGFKKRLKNSREGF